MSEPKDVIARKLVHDVGKYVTRAARNLPSVGPIPDVLADMLRRDVFGAPSDAASPEQKFELLANALAIGDARLDEVRARFVHASALRSSTDEAALRAIAADAMAIERALGALAHELTEAAR